MIWKLSLFGLLLCVTADGHPYAISEQSMKMNKDHKAKLSHVGEHTPEHHDEYAWSYPSYEFSYKVKDPHTHDEKGQHEARHGDEVRGEYWLIEPDGRKRTVHYTVEKQSGFNAIVEYSRPLHHIRHKSEGEDNDKDEESSSDKDGKKDLKESDGDGVGEKGDEENAKKHKEEKKEEEKAGQEDNGEKISEDGKETDKDIESHEHKKEHKEDHGKDKKDKDEKEYELFHGFMSFPSYGSRISKWKESSKKVEGDADEDVHKDKEVHSEEEDTKKNQDEDKDEEDKEKSSKKEPQGWKKGWGKGFSYVQEYRYKTEGHKIAKGSGHEELKDTVKDGNEDKESKKNKDHDEGKHETEEKSHKKEEAKVWLFDEMFGLKHISGRNEKRGEEDRKYKESKGLGAYASDASDRIEKRNRGGIRDFSGIKSRGYNKYRGGVEDQDREGRSSFNIATKSFPKTIENYRSRGHGQQRFLGTIGTKH